MEPIIRGALIYAILLLLFRVAGKRTLSEVTPFDLVFAEATESALTDDDRSFTNAFLVIPPS